MFKFARIKRNDLHGEVEWKLLIEDIDSLNAFLDVRSNFVAMEYLEMKECIQSNKHLNSRHQYLMQFTLENANIPYDKRNIGTDINIIDDKFLNSYVKSFLKCGTLAVSSTGGYYCLKWMKNIEILEIIERDKYQFPVEKLSFEELKKQIKVFKWENGRHYYAKVNSEDVVIDGKQSWNTWNTAHRNAEKYIKEAMIEEE